MTKKNGQLKKTSSYWKAKADKVFSLFVRKRDSENGGRCITCNKWFPYNELDAGHFISRNCLQLRYDERNVNSQCRLCNRFRNGEQALYSKALDAKYGDGTADELLEIYKNSKSDIGKFSAQFYEDIFNKYK